MNRLAPIVIFVYNRPDHTLKTITALKNNFLSSDSELFIFSDAAKNESDKVDVNRVREVISNISGFKKVCIIKQERNIGLAGSIINGVTDIVNKYGQVIVLEDDLVTSPHFLTYMNEALCFYKNEKSVWHISGWNYPIKTEGLGDTFLWRTMNCWGWATWSDRWQHFEKNSEKLIQSFDSDKIKSLNIDGATNFWDQVLLNNKGKINTWAVFWYATIFSNKGLCLNPSASLVVNIGVDGSGSNCGISDVFTSVPSNKTNFIFQDKIEECSLALNRVKDFYNKIDRPYIVRVINKIYRLFTSRNLIK
ncbi:glycosyltransferase [Vibrio diabolicus]|uniref:glycosyltransferase n=1 Tax=Vibrio diabolicus TaxID=50719 RepID=UPI002940F154|nr:glycosyltransferase [Vibrio diabolicus]MDV5037640.1 glycosyltransferase [Vibrio diabolicus]